MTFSVAGTSMEKIHCSIDNRIQASSSFQPMIIGNSCKSSPHLSKETGMVVLEAVRIGGAIVSHSQNPVAS